jgi:hypothetical protein
MVVMRSLGIVILTIFSIAYTSQWQIPVSLGYSVNAPSFTGDGSKMYCCVFYSIYGYDIAYYEWNGSQWIYGDRVPGDVNTGYQEEEPFISYDGNKLYYMRTVTQTGQPYHLWVATWDGSGFNNSNELNSLINSADCRFPCLTQDGQKLYFSRATGNGLKIYESSWNGSDWDTPVILPVEVNGPDTHDRMNVTISPDGNELYFTGAGDYWLFLAYSKKDNNIWQQWQYCDSNINKDGKNSSWPALTYAPYATQELYFNRTSEGTLHALRSPISVTPTSLGNIKALYAK